MAGHSSLLAWRIPLTEKPGVLQYMGLQRVGHGSATEQQQGITSHMPQPVSMVVQVVKNLLAVQETGDSGLIPGVEKIPQRREWQPIQVFLPGESHGQRSLAGSQRRRHD